MSSTIRQQVRAAITACMYSAITEGRCPWDAARAAFPGTPEQVLGEAFCDASDAEEEAWWRTIERTIDVEVIRAAITTTGGS